MMNAVIWLEAMLEAQTPTAARPAASSAAPTYCATMGPHWRSAPSPRDSGMGRVSASAVQRKSRLPRYFPASSSSSVIGCARTTSSTPFRVSSASVRIVTAGTKKSNSQGSRSSIGRRLADPARYDWRKKRKAFTPRNTTSST
jgi:hypothetical protein